MPKPDEIILNYPADRIRALRTFTTENDSTVEDELLIALEKLFQKRVPSPVRMYLGDADAAPSPPRKRPTQRPANPEN